MKPTLFLTGAAGFVGRNVREVLLRSGAFSLRSLVRNRRLSPAEGEEQVSGDLLDTTSYAHRLAGCDAVLHLAAATGKCPREVYFEQNLSGTKALLSAAAQAGVRRFVYVSSIAAKFADLRRYPYAQSKLSAEEAVRLSGLSWTIIRPTMVIGEGSPVLEGLARLAAVPVVPVFGNGNAPVQPIAAEDLAQVILGVVRGGADAQILEAGGPEVLTIEQFLRSIRESLHGRSYRALHIPLEPLATVLHWAEPWLLRALPVTAGQLSSFVCDGTAQPPGGWDASAFKTVKEVLTRLAPNQRPGA